MEMMLEVIKAIPEWSEVRVRWRDAYSPAAGWHDVATYEPKDATATTMGRIWHDVQDNYVTIVGTIFESELPNPECVGDINHIPVAWVLDLEVIRRYEYEGQ